MLITAEIITARIPFMPSIGNHEYALKHKSSKQVIVETYKVPYGDPSQYSFEVGDIRFQAFNPYEEIFDGDFSKTDQKIEWLKNDFNSKRNGVNWVIPFSHYPYYCGSV